MAKHLPGEVAFKKWLDDCSSLLVRDLGIDDALEANDPYSIMEAAQGARIDGVSYIDFVHDMFEEDYANKEYDEELRRESEESNASEEEYDDE